ncbi:MAG: basic amino acid ABC transporter substrate-binding protein [Thermoanaerobacterales bacterium]|nr:basic amino acid ABC transporter substrate-binding protein [Bacillota bacterium]MDI6908002.1 basic amino acid ABC transporter substrate-binding protein [Thermoanaerobacterales bacterium]
MLRLNRFMVVAVALLTLVAFVAGCGGGSSSQDQKAADDQAQQAPEKKVLKIGSDTAYAPFEWQDTKSGDYVGFDMDLMAALCEEMGYKPDIQSMTFDGLIPALQSGTIDASISAMTIKKKRLQQVSFSDPYYKSGLIIAVRNDNNDIKSFDDLKGKTIAVQLGTTGADKAKEIEGAKVVTFDRIPEAFLELKKGSADAVVNDAPVTMYAIKQDGSGQIKVVGDMLSTEFYGIAVPKDKPELLQEFNAALKKLKETGKFTELYKKWFGQEPPADVLNPPTPEEAAIE